MNKQNNTYQVLYSDGVTVLEYIMASNLKEAKEIAKTKNYKTAYYMVRRCYNGGVNAVKNNWH